MVEFLQIRAKYATDIYR